MFNPVSYKTCFYTVKLQFRRFDTVQSVKKIELFHNTLLSNIINKLLVAQSHSVNDVCICYFIYFTILSDHFHRMCIINIIIRYSRCHLM